MIKNDMSNSELNVELDGLKRNEQIADWSISLGYGEAEYTLELNRQIPIDAKALAKRLNKLYGAKSFSQHTEGKSVAIKFVIDL